MSVDPATHYRNVLARHYSWMLGGDVERVAASDRELVERLGVVPAAGSEEGVAVDLGCGHGPQTLSVADMGFGTVVGIDTSRELLDELAFAFIVSLGDDAVAPAADQ